MVMAICTVTSAYSFPSLSGMVYHNADTTKLLGDQFLSF